MDVRALQRHVCVQIVIGLAIVNLWGCVAEFPPLVDQAQVSGTVTVGRVVAAITGERARRYPPEVRFFELEDRRTQERLRVMIESPDQQFVVALPPGDYLLTRVQISEGPFMSVADLAITFSVGTGPVSYVGTWCIGVDSPRYGRMVAVSIELDPQERAQTLDALLNKFPILARQSVEDIRAEPSKAVARLFEVMPYPRIHRYFRRHWW